jgi:hypothetical protein
LEWICGKEFKSYSEQEEMGERRNRSNKRLIGPSRDMKGGGYDEYLGKCCIQKPHP